MSKVLLGYNAKVTYPYGNGHTGVDCVGTTNGSDSLITAICAHSEGTVVAVRKDYKTIDRTGNSYGNYVVINHANGYQTLYAHLQYNSVCVNVGDHVNAMSRLGLMGETGRTNGAHLHFEVKKDGVRIDPTPYLNEDFPNPNPVTVDGAPEIKPEPKPQDSTIHEGDIVIVNGVGHADSYGGGARTRNFTNHTMKVIYVREGRPYPYACNQYANDNGVTGWFDNVHKA